MPPVPKTLNCHLPKPKDPKPSVPKSVGWLVLGHTLVFLVLLGCIGFIRVFEGFKGLDFRDLGLQKEETPQPQSVGQYVR